MSLSNKSANPQPASARQRHIKQWHKIFGSDPPLRIGGGLLLMMLEQARQESSLQPAFRALERQLASSTSKQSNQTSVRAHLRVGGRIIRGWGGANHEVTVLPKGYSYRGEVYRSLSEIARLITGTRWSGPRFFGTRERYI